MEMDTDGIKEEMTGIFTDEQENYEILLGAYKKLKSYYHYNKNFLFMREKLAKFEYDAVFMEEKLKHIAKMLTDPKKYFTEINSWIELIDYYVLPKAYVSDAEVEKRFVTGSIPHKSISKVIFFIDMPIELHLLDTVWTLYSVC